MKKIIPILSIVLLYATTANAQWWGSSEKIKGNNEMTQQTRSVGDYDQISVSGMMEVELVSGQEGKIQVEAESNLMEYIETEVNNGHLKISVKKGVNLQPSNNNKIKLVVPFEDINKVALTGSGEIFNSNEIKSRDFEVSLTGSGNINLLLVSQNLEGKLTGSGDVNLRGKAENFDVRVTGSGDFKAFDLRSRIVHAAVMGSGDIEVNPEEELNARITGSGDITYSGNPSKQDFKSTGSGSVSKQ